MSSLNLLVISNPVARHLTLLERLPANTTITVADNVEGLIRAAPAADVVLNCTGNGQVLSKLWADLPSLRWVHSLAAGVENQLFRDLVESPVPLTNSRGIYKESLGEFVLAAVLFFAKDLRRMVRSQEAGRWDQFDIEEISRQTMGIIGYGEIGRAAARRAKALGMKVHIVRRRPELSREDTLVDRSFTISERSAMISICDYVVVAAPLTPETRGLIGGTEFGAFKTSGVLINVGRGPVVDEEALVTALSNRRIKGAALDVFDQEPLPEGHPFWRLDNVLLSPHCADHTATWLEEGMQFFIDNFERFRKGEPLANVVDKRAGY
jgi:phosphoglycerate dehydrogenase-like enzyme